MLTTKQILTRIKSSIDHPATVRELMERLTIPREQRVTFCRRLANLVKKGELIKIRGNRYGLPSRMHLVTGEVHVNPRGFGFVTPEESTTGLDGDLYVAGANLNQAMNGDRVVARVERRRPGSRSEGRIVRILERRTKQLVGRFEVDKSGLVYVVPFDRRIVTDVHIPEGKSGQADVGEVVVVALTRWPTSTRGPVGEVTEVLGNLDSPGVDTELVIREFQLPDHHVLVAVAEARKWGQKIRPRDLKGRHDFRSCTTVTIDGESARDFDDAITLECLANGNFWLGVHIADVGHYVPEGSVLDVAAYERATSVYFPDRAVHMFPEVLSTGICSLKPKVDRLVQSCLMEIDARGKVVRYEIQDGVIRSDARMTYTEVNAILVERNAQTRNAYAELVELFDRMEDLFKVLSNRRQRRGSIDFDLPSAEFVMDDAGQVTGIVAAERNQAHRIIEEFMLIANETVGEYLEESPQSMLYRVHQSPDPLKIEEFEGFATSLGYSLGARSEQVVSKDFQRLLKRLNGRPEQRPVASLMLRTMQQARYDTVNRGHFGLAAPVYTHFTSPIRRYPDLVVHRLLRDRRLKRFVGDGGSDDRLRHLDEVARHTSKLERRAEDAEREVIQWKKVRFMSDKVGDEFAGHITGVAAIGLFVELLEPFVEGLVHISSMADDYYQYFERQHELRGENNGKRYRLGDMVKVQLARVDRDHRRIELALVEILEKVGRQTGRRPSRGAVIRRGKRRKGPRRNSKA